MITIHNYLNLKYEAYTFVTRYVTQEKRYHQTIDDDFKAHIDQIYHDAKAMMDSLFEGKDEILTLFTSLTDLRKMESHPPLFDYYMHDEKGTPQSSVFEYIKFRMDKTLESESDSVFQMLSQLEIDTKEKWILLDIYENADQRFQEFTDVMNQVMDYLKPRLEVFDERINSAYDEWVEINNTKGLEKFFSEAYNFNTPQQDFDFYLSIIGMNQGSFHNEDIYFGVDVNKSLLARSMMTFEQASKIFKFLGDPTKSGILKCLKKKSMYGKELASELNLTSATISYHIQELMNERLLIVSVSDSSNRLYYELNTQTLIQAFDYAKSYFSEDGEV